MSRIVIALGGNALQSGKGAATAQAQLETVNATCEYIAEMMQKDYEVAIVHGNGPQIGRILLASETAKDITPVMPFDVCGAMSQGYIGYHIQQGMRKALDKRGIKRPVASLVTQVVVDKNDPGFANPTKPIGAFYSKEEADALAAEKGYTMKEDAGRGWRRVIASPLPMRIQEIDTIKYLLAGNTVLITCGGGGIPVIEGAAGLEGVAAVIDKDFSAEKLAEEIGAEVLMILTEVEQAAIHFGKPNQENLGNITVAQAEKYIAEGHFAPGSMLPKVQAAVKFAKTGKRAIITALDKAIPALEGKTGTVVTI
ncbi:MAG: carbamate kinase [Defluviitaleaceae bacterium]|nr:carbamate kinase [Defluviitaleaceae bacterium]MCL2240374.1 carbamate kinase [Defluviitaleaceae bacterium]